MNWPTAIAGLLSPSEGKGTRPGSGLGPRPLGPATAEAKGTRPRRRSGTTAARRIRGRALPDHGNPREGAHKGRGGIAVLMRERRKTEVERFAGAGTSSGELGHGRAGKKRPPRTLTSPTAATHGRN